MSLHVANKEDILVPVPKSDLLSSPISKQISIRTRPLIRSRSLSAPPQERIQVSRRPTRTSTSSPSKSRTRTRTRSPTLIQGPSRTSLPTSSNVASSFTLPTCASSLAPSTKLQRSDPQEPQTYSNTPLGGIAENVETHNEGWDVQNNRLSTSGVSRKRKQLDLAQYQPRKRLQEERSSFIQDKPVNSSLPQPSVDLYLLSGGDHKQNGEEDRDIPSCPRERDIGRVIAYGGLGEVLAYKRGQPETLVVKIYVHANSFERELRAYRKILASEMPIPIPQFLGQVVFPASFRSPRRLQKYQTPYKPHSLGLVLERLKGPVLSDVLHLLDMSQLVALRQEIRAGLEDLHRIGISHQDIKENNIMFRREQPKDWVFIDFGEAKFSSELSGRAWQQACANDQADVATIFDTAEAQYAIQAGLHFLEYYGTPSSDGIQSTQCIHINNDCPVLAADCLRKHVGLNTSTTLARDDVQRHLASILKAATRIPATAFPLVSTILTTFPSPIPRLAKYATNILHCAGGSHYALYQLDVQLSNSELPLDYQVQFHRTKISILKKHGSITERLAALKAAVPVLVEYYGEEDPRSRSAKQELERLLAVDAEESRYEGLTTLRYLPGRMNSSRISFGSARLLEL
ncbi:hypothetical protein VTL71DRAFT_9454 [Oculimacula yallundae]|uniref:Protein kinase domain-containing protein n=1 Tax=Oculimacula yallundae TaxID=86028 RepID=A0ABR4BTP9_9HELO